MQLTTLTRTPEMPTTRVLTRTAQLRRIHVAAHRLGLETRPGHDRSAYEGVLLSITGQRSCKRMGRADRERVLTFLEAEVDAQRPAPVREVVSDEEALAILG